MFLGGAGLIGLSIWMMSSKDGGDVFLFPLSLGLFMSIGSYVYVFEQGTSHLGDNGDLRNDTVYEKIGGRCKFDGGAWKCQLIVKDPAGETIAVETTSHEEPPPFFTVGETENGGPVSFAPYPPTASPPIVEKVPTPIPAPQ